MRCCCVQRDGATGASLQTLVPFPRPGELLCAGLNYLDHAKDGGLLVPDDPTLFARFGTGLVASAADA